jgi:hypothetical protein
MLPSQDSPRSRVAILTVAGGLGGIVVPFLLTASLCGWRTWWGFLAGAVPGLALGMLSWTPPDGAFNPEKLRALIAFSFVTGLIISILAMFVMLLNSGI